MLAPKMNTPVIVGGWITQVDQLLLNVERFFTINKLHRSTQLVLESRFVWILANSHFAARHSF
jgi:hypothetical protein